jgi:two-component system nitrogen regulation sensor histidine kinase GlnL
MDGILLVSEGRVISASSQASEVLELSQSRLLGASLDDLLSDSLDEAFERLAEGAASVTLRGLPWKRVGRRGQVTVSVTTGPQPGQFVVQLRDESDPSGQEAAEGFRRRLTWLDSLAAGIAHEIRNPLGGIRGAAQLLQRGPTPAEGDELTQMIVLESDRIDRMVEQLMKLTRPRTLERSDVDVNGLILDEVALLRAQFGSEQVDWQLDLDPSLPTVEGDRLRLREAVSNLLRNAREAAASTVTVKTRIEAGERLREDGFDRGQSLHLEVRDDGPGIAESDASSIFAPFSTTKPEGSGLGLFVTRQVVDDHGARLSLDSVPGHGALFRLSLHERLAPAEHAGTQDALPADFHFGRPGTYPLPPIQETPR